MYIVWKMLTLQKRLLKSGHTFEIAIFECKFNF